MKHNEDVIKGKWFEVREEIKEAWNKLDAEELDETQGKLEAVRGLITKRYGALDEQDTQKLADILSGASIPSSQKFQSSSPTDRNAPPKDHVAKQKSSHGETSTHSKT